jgi:P pilus assembly chaperone PapD
MTRLNVMAMVAVALIGTPLQAQMRVDNADLWLTATASVGTFTVTNEGTDVLQFTLENADWDRADDGANRFYPAGSTPSSCERALEVFPRQLRLTPGASQTVRVSLRADSLPSRACWSLIFVQTEPPSAQSRSSAIRYITRIGVKIYYTPPQTVTLAEIEGFVQIPRDAPRDSNAVELAVRNVGTRAIAIDGTVEIRRADNFVVAKIPVEAIPVLPAALRRIRVNLPQLLPGNYIALAVFDYGADEDLAAQTPVEIR